MAPKKNGQKSKNKASIIGKDLLDGKAISLETKLLKWKECTKPSQHFPFLDNRLFADFIKNDQVSNVQKGNRVESNKKTSQTLEGVEKYSSLVKYIEKYSDHTELDSILHNIAFIYGTNKESVRSKLFSTKVNIQKVPKHMSVDEYLISLIEDKKPEPIVIDVEEPEVIVIDETSDNRMEEMKNLKSRSNKQGKINLKDISDANGLTLIRKTPTKSSKSKKAEKIKKKTKVGDDSESDSDEIFMTSSKLNPIKKKLKNDKRVNVDIVIDLEDESLSDMESKVNVKEIKPKKSILTRTKKQKWNVR